MALGISNARAAPASFSEPPAKLKLLKLATVSARKTPRTTPLQLHVGWLDDAHHDKNKEPARMYFSWSDEGWAAFVGAEVSDKERNTKGVKCSGARIFQIQSHYLPDCGLYSQYREGNEPWRQFFYAIACAEGDYWGAINTYDGCYLTFGPFQFAGHAEYFNEFLTALTGEIYRTECEVYWPQLLEYRSKGLDLGSFASIQNPKRDVVEPEEIEAAARLLVWCAESPGTRAVQFEVMQRITAKHLQSIRSNVGDKFLNVSEAWECAVLAVDAMHHGRRPKSGTRMDAIRDAYRSTTPRENLKKISNAAWQDDRISKVDQRLRLQRRGKDAELMTAASLEKLLI